MYYTICCITCNVKSVCNPKTWKNEEEAYPWMITVLREENITLALNITV